MRHVTLGAISAFVVVCLVLSLVPSGLSATTWLTYREDVSFTSGTVDIDIESVNQTVDVLHTASTNVTLPCKLSELNQTLTVFRTNTSGTNVTFNLTVNGVDVNSSSPINWTTGNWSNVTLAMVIAAGVSQNDTYLNISTNANDTATVYGRIYADDAAFTSAWLSSNVVVKEKDIVTPYIKPTATQSFFTVNDSINVSNTIGYTLSDVNLTPTFPSQTITDPATYFNVGALSNNSSTQTYTQYQKYGPHVYNIDDNSIGMQHDVTILIQTSELLTNCVDWSVDISDDGYDDVFDALDYGTLEVTFNGQTVDWEQGSINMDGFTMYESQSQNKFVFTWTESIPSVPTATEAWYSVMFLGLALYMWLLIIIAIAVIAIFVLLLTKK